MPILKRVIIDLPANADDISPRLLKDKSLVSELRDILLKINDVVHRGCPKLHLAVTYLANLSLNKYGVNAQCQDGYSDRNHNRPGIVLILDLHPIMKQDSMSQDHLADGVPQQSPKSTAKFSTRLSNLLKQSRLTGSRYDSVCPNDSELASADSREVASDSDRQWMQQLSSSRSHDVPPLLVNNLVC